MKTRVEPLVGGLLFLSFRALLGLGVIVLGRWVSREADMLLLLDLPTLGFYFLMARLGQEHDITDAYDIRFFLAAMAVWFVVGYLGMVVVSAVRRQLAKG